MKQQIRVVVAEDQDLLRRSLALVIGTDATMVVVGEAANGREAIDVVRATKPDVVLMDVRMPILDGIAATKELSADSDLDGTRILILSMFELDEYVLLALRAGASGFLLKDTNPEDLLAAIRRTWLGEALFAPTIMTRMIERYMETTGQFRKAGSLDGLTIRETEVLRIIGLGRSNDEIASDLSISVKTVKSHISHLLAKLEVRDRVHLVILAYETGLVAPRASGSSRTTER